MLKKGDKTINEYARLFMEKLRLCGHLCRNEEARVSRYVLGLPAEYRGFCRKSKTLAEAIEESKSVDDDMKAKTRKKSNSGFKRKSDGSSGSSKKFKSGSSKNGDEKKMASWCDRCKSKHTGPCTAATLRCNK